MNKQLLTTGELAKYMGISRIAVYRKIKKGQIKAIRVGRNFAVEKDLLPEITGKKLSETTKQQIDLAINKTINEYGGTLKLLGKD